MIAVNLTLKHLDLLKFLADLTKEILANPYPEFTLLLLIANSEQTV